MIQTLTTRLQHIGISLTYTGNFPWIYLDTVNGNKITTYYGANHGYYVFMQTSNDIFKLYDRKHLFQTIRKHL